MENRVDEKIAGALQVIGDGLRQVDVKQRAADLLGGGAGKYLQQPNDFFPRDGFVQADA